MTARALNAHDATVMQEVLSCDKQNMHSRPLSRFYPTRIIHLSLSGFIARMQLNLHHHHPLWLPSRSRANCISHAPLTSIEQARGSPGTQAPGTWHKSRVGPLRRTEGEPSQGETAGHGDKSGKCNSRTGSIDRGTHAWATSGCAGPAHYDDVKRSCPWHCLVKMRRRKTRSINEVNTPLQGIKMD